MSPERHHSLLLAHMARSGLSRLVKAGQLRDFGVLELEPLEGTHDLRDRLFQTGNWVSDPLPDVRRKQKPWVLWSVRERRVGPALHVEQENDCLSVHIDVLNPGAAVPLMPLHALVDLWGWRTLRPYILSLL